jgi:hypothetical protein
MSGVVAFAAENLRGHGGRPLTAKIAKKCRKDAESVGSPFLGRCTAWRVVEHVFQRLTD